MAKPKVCSVCTLPVKGHRGPHGRGKCTAGFSPGSDNNSDSIEERVRRSLKKLKRDSKAKELAKGLWSEASEEERVPTARDLREDDDLLGKRPVSSRKRSSSDSTTRSSTSRSRSTDGSRSRRRRSNDHKGHRRRHRSARRRYSSDSRSSSSPRRRRRGKKSGRTKTINDSASSRVKIEWPHHHVHFPGKGKGGDGCVTYDDLSTSMFVHGFVKNLLEKKHVKRSVRIRLEHLSDLMFDAAYYDWGIVRETHASVLYAMENGTISWSSSKETIDNTRERSYRAQAGVSHPPAAPRAQARSTARDPNRPRWCEAYQHGNCQQGPGHWDPRWGQVKHICCMCLLVRRVEEEHPKTECRHGPRSFRQPPGDNTRRAAGFSSQPGATGTGGGHY